MGLQAQIDQAVADIHHMAGEEPFSLGIILGSGWGSVAGAVSCPVVVPFSQVTGMQNSTAAGHAGQFVLGYFGGRRCVVMQGRLHGYEGYTAQEVAFPVWVMAKLGAGALVTTNAAGALNAGYQVGDYCLMSDQINLTGRNPLASAEAALLGERFISMKDAFSPALRELIRESADREAIPLQEGVYVGVLGPSFETPAEIHAYQLLGGDTIAMSVCEEVIAARQMNMQVAGISLVTNMGCGIAGSNPSDNEVREVGRLQLDMSRRLLECTATLLPTA